MTEVNANQQPMLAPQLIVQAFDLVIDELHRHLVAAGYDDLRPTHVLNVFRFMDCDGTRPTVLARRAKMTPQAMSELIGYLEERGYVRRVPDPDDRRARVVVYADRGSRAAEVGEAFFADLESRWGAVTGPDRVKSITTALTDIVAADSDRSSPST
ncbi:MarR family winged helix-turn-helix transcriptional regulator [Glycomyces xiaoerkulensis]|uniref:MarR family winged helix-turn-helix transcriptional regulator n=1 Tax=Glycomyces xiaoerkulensis TaxID=2038139 RepID=UPI0012FFE979|nr:MarR family winged helix-turn-helix transcriptional regulator [Glycomyces xiaoerkulensis]